MLLKPADEDFKFSTFEHACITNSSHSINFVIVYRPPPSTENGLTKSMFLHEFDKFVCDVSLLPDKLILLGDFNVHWDCPTKSDVLQFSSSTSSAGLTQYVYGPTHKDGHTLDLVFTRCDDTFLHDCYTEDNLCQIIVLYVSLLIPKPTPQRVTSTLRDFQKMNHDDFSKSISEMSLHQISLSNANADYDTCSNSLFECYDTGLKTILDLHAPFTTRTRTIKTRMPWYN